MQDGEITKVFDVCQKIIDCHRWHEDNGTSKALAGEGNKFCCLLKDSTLPVSPVPALDEFNWTILHCCHNTVLLSHLRTSYVIWEYVEMLNGPKDRCLESNMGFNATGKDRLIYELNWVNTGKWFNQRKNKSFQLWWTVISLIWWIMFVEVIILSYLFLFVQFAYAHLTIPVCVWVCVYTWVRVHVCMCACVSDWKLLVILYSHIPQRPHSSFECMETIRCSHNLIRRKRNILTSVSNLSVTVTLSVGGYAEHL